MSTPNKKPVATSKSKEVVTPSQDIDFIGRLGNVLKSDPSEYTEVVKGENDTEVVITKQTYNFANPQGKRTALTIYDASIIESMEMIKHAMQGKTLLTYAICKAFSNIDLSGKLDKYGFKNIAEFGKVVYGLETSTVNHYARIGKNFLNDDFTVKAGLPQLSVSHLIELSSKVEDGDISKIVSLYADGSLTDGMSTKVLRETLKKLSTPLIESTDNKENDSTEKKDATTENSATVVPTETDMTELKANFDSQVAIGRIINACSVIDELFEMLAEHEVAAIGYAEKVDALKAIAKALLK